MLSTDSKGCSHAERRNLQRVSILYLNLNRKAASFLGRSDTEVVLNLYLVYGL